ncbi:MAG: DUF2064 domain-containing protein [Peptococcaceae bacterium]|jgi:glycosyltransferase A (GT-A) superfamily protein (DUF2064 family)|nr:DUF2064 domain-containing protein [Peptococcaceae bacterium]
MKTAIVIFTKVPQEGQTKTRLTEERGGIFSAKEAKDFYEASLLDVMDSCIRAQSGDLYICYNLNGDRNYLQQLIQSNFDSGAVREIFQDQGGTFDQAMQYAFDYIFRKGGEDRLAEGAIIVGGDSPCLQAATVKEAVKKLELLALSNKALECMERYSGNTKSAAFKPAIGASIIESIDQEGGFNLIGYTYTTPFNFNGVFYNQDGVTALDMVAKKAAEKNIPLALVEMVPDVDLPVDVASLIPVLNTLIQVEKFDPNITAPKRTIKFLQDFGFQTVATANSYEATRF